MKKDLKYFGLFAALTLVYFSDPILSGRFLAIGDGISETFPMMAEIGRQLREFKFPFWNQYMFSGFPIMAAMQFGVFYPLNSVLFAVLRPELAYNLNVIFHYCIAGFFAFLYLRRLGLGIFGATVGGMSYGLLGYLPFHLQHFHLLTPGAFLPLVFYFLEDLKESPSIKTSARFSIVLAIQLVSGHPQVIFFTWNLVGIYILFHLATTKNDGGARFLLYSLGAFLLTILITLPQLAATYELSGLGNTMSRTYEAFSSFSLPRHLVPGFFLPFLYGGFEGFIGTFPVILAVIVFWREEKTDPRVRFWGLAVVIAFVLALGDTLRPLHKLMFHVPVYNFFRASSKHLIEVSFGLAVLSGFGADRLMRNDPKGEYRRGLLIGLFAVLTIAAVCLSPMGGRFQGHYGINLQPGILLAIVIAVSGAIVSVWLLPKLGEKAGYLLIGFLMLEALSYRPVTEHSMNYPAEYRKELMTFLSRDTTARTAFVSIEIDEAMLAQGRGIRMIDGYDPLITGDYSTLLDMEPYGFSHQWPALIDNNIILSMLNTKYLVVDKSDTAIAEIRGVSRPGGGFSAPIGSAAPRLPGYAPVYKQVFNDNDVKVYENLNVMPNAYSVKRLKPIEGIEELKLNLYAFQIDPREEAGLSDADIKTIGKTNFSIGNVTIVERKADETRMKVDFGSEGFLVLSDSYYPGWKALVDGKETQIFKTNGVIRGVVVPAGSHDVRFVYRPYKLYLFMLVGAIAFIAVLRLALRR